MKSLNVYLTLILLVAPIFASQAISVCNINRETILKNLSMVLLKKTIQRVLSKILIQSREITMKVQKVIRL